MLNIKVKSSSYSLRVLREERSEALRRLRTVALGQGRPQRGADGEIEDLVDFLTRVSLASVDSDLIQTLRRLTAHLEATLFVSLHAQQSILGFHQRCLELLVDSLSDKAAELTPGLGERVTECLEQIIRQILAVGDNLGQGRALPWTPTTVSKLLWILKRPENVPLASLFLCLPSEESRKNLHSMFQDSLDGLNDYITFLVCHLLSTKSGTEDSSQLLGPCCSFLETLWEEVGVPELEERVLGLLDALTQATDIDEAGLVVSLIVLTLLGKREWTSRVRVFRKLAEYLTSQQHSEEAPMIWVLRFWVTALSLHSSEATPFLELNYPSLVQVLATLKPTNWEDPIFLKVLTGIFDIGLSAADFEWFAVEAARFCAQAIAHASVDCWGARTLWFLKTLAAILATYEFSDDTFRGLFSDPRLWEVLEVLQQSPETPTHTASLLILQEWNRTQQSFRPTPDINGDCCL